MALFQVISGIGSPSASQMRVAFPFSNVVSFLSCIIWGCTVKNTNYITHPGQRMSHQNLLIHSSFFFTSTFMCFFLHRINVLTLPTTRAISLSDFKLHFNQFYMSDDLDFRLSMADTQADLSLAGVVWDGPCRTRPLPWWLGACLCFWLAVP